MSTRTSCTTRGYRDVRGMSRKGRTRLVRRDLGRLRRVDDRREAGPNVPPSPFCLLFLEAPRGLVASPRDGRRANSDGARRAVSMTPAYESSRCGAGRRSVASPSGAAWHCRSRGDHLAPERASRAPRHVRLVIVPSGRLVGVGGDDWIEGESGSLRRMGVARDGERPRDAFARLRARGRPLPGALRLMDRGGSGARGACA